MSSRLLLFDTGPTPSAHQTLEGAPALTAALNDWGIEYARWPLPEGLRETSSPAEVLALYEAQVSAVTQRFGYQSVDVLGLTPEHPQAAASREKFLSEHTHDDDEARYFARGSGTFYLHFPAREAVAALVCTAGDWVRVPAGTPHWFDMGPKPSFSVIRLFTRPDGWVARFTGSPIAERFPPHDVLAAPR